MQHVTYNVTIIRSLTICLQAALAGNWIQHVSRAPSVLKRVFIEFIFKFCAILVTYLFLLFIFWSFEIPL